MSHLRLVPGATSVMEDMSTLLGDASAVGQPTVSPVTELANAHRIRTHFSNRLMYVRGIGWHIWGPPWRHDEDAAREIASGLSQIIAAEAAAQAAAAAQETNASRRKALNEEVNALARWAVASESRAHMEASMALAASLTGLCVKRDALNLDPLLLATAQEVIDLRTGECREHRHDDHITLCAGTVYDASMLTPVWDAMMARLFPTKPEVIAYIEGLAGYALTGLTAPEMLSVWHGTGANGKSTLARALLAIAGDYGGAAAPGLLIAHHQDRHPTELADLRDKRLVFAHESGQGARLNEGLVKQLTGGDHIIARRMHENFSSFRPTHKLILLTNHRPVISGTDDGIWRRVQLVPFLETILPAERAPDMDQRLAAELPGLLARLVMRAVDVVRTGYLHVPEEVAAASAAYRADQDSLGGFLADRCMVDLQGRTKAADLRAAYTEWCAAAGEQPMSARALGEALSERGFATGRAPGGARLRVGLRLTAAVTPVTDVTPDPGISANESIPYKKAEANVTSVTPDESLASITPMTPANESCTDPPLTAADQRALHDFDTFNNWDRRHD